MSVIVNPNNYVLSDESIFDRHVGGETTDITFVDSGVQSTLETYRMASLQGQSTLWNAALFVASQIGPQLEATGAFNTEVRRGARYPYLVVSGTFGLLTKSPIFVSSVKPIPVGLDVNNCQPQEGWLQVQFDRQPEDDSDYARNLVLEESFGSSIEILTLSNVNLFWDNAQVERIEDFDAPTDRIFTREYTFKRKYLTEIDSSVTALESTVNDAPFTIPGVDETYGIGEVLCTKVKPEQIIQFDGRKVWAVEVSLRARAGRPWNYGVKAGTTAHVPIYDSAGTEFKSYLESSFSPLDQLLSM